MTKMTLSAISAAIGALAIWLVAPQAIKDKAAMERRATSATPADQTISPPEIEVVRGIGYVEPVTEVRRLTFKVDGVIEALMVEVGQRVKQKDVLARLINRDEEAIVVEARAHVSLAEARRDHVLAGIHGDQIQASAHRLDQLAEKVRHSQKRFDRLWKIGFKALSKDELEQAETDFRQGEHSLAEARADLSHLKSYVRPVDRTVAESQVSLAKMRVKSAESRLENTFLRAPLDGWILEIIKRAGEGVRVIDHEPVLIIADLSKIRIRAEIDERWVSRMKVGQTCEVYGRGLADARHKGTLSLVKQLMAPKTLFTRESSERKDLDVLQVFIDMPTDFSAPIGLQVDVDVRIQGD
jgi:multidrug resistance efflux pump